MPIIIIDQVTSRAKAAYQSAKQGLRGFLLGLISKLRAFVQRVLG